MKIVIVDDHVLFREGLAAIIRSESDLKIIGQAGSVREAIETVKALKPDLVLMDFGLPDGTGADATRAILHEHKWLRLCGQRVPVSRGWNGHDISPCSLQ